MKKIKVSFFAVIAIIIGMAASSFTIHAAKTTAMNWYEFNGTGDPADAADYDLATSDPTCNTTPDIVCAVRADEGNTGKPSQSELDAIVTASGSFTLQASNLRYKH